MHGTGGRVYQLESTNGRIAKIIHDTAITLIAELLVLLAFFVFYRLLLDEYGSENLGLYALSRRVIAFLIPLMLLGLYDGMGRYLAMAIDGGERSKLVVIGFVSLLLTSAVSLFVLVSNEDASSRVIFGSSDYAELVLPFSVIVIGLSLHTFVHAALRGTMRIKTLNALQLINLGVLPILLVLFYPGDFPSLMLVMGVTHGAVAILPIILLIASGFRDRPWSFQLRRG